MRILPIHVGINVYKKNTNEKSYINKQEETDTISFSAKIPPRIKAELKYQPLTRRDMEGKSNQLYSSTNPEVITLLEQLKDDKDVTDEFKEKIIRGDSEREYPLSIRIQLAKRDDVKTKFNLQVANALLNASPNDEVKKKQLLTPSIFADKKIPLHYAKSIDVAQFLLDASPDEETKNAQLLAKDKEGNTPLFTINNRSVREYLLNSCSYEMQRKQLISASNLFSKINSYTRYKEIDEDLSLAPDEKTRLDMLKVTDTSGQNLFHHASVDRAKYLLNKFEGYPNDLKEALLRKDNKGYIPITTCFSDAASILLKASPDDETLKAQLLARNRHGERLISIDKNNMMNYLMMSPDDETLLEQLFERISTDKQLMPIIETLDTKNLISIIDKLKSNSAKCKLLLSRWSIIENRFDKENSTTQKSIDINLQKQLISPYGYNRFEKEYLSETIADILFEVIQDDTTSNQEAIDLMYRYYNIVTEEKRAYFDEIIEYLRQN